MKALLLAMTMILMPTNSGKTIESYRDQARPLLLFAPSGNDPRLLQQMSLLQDEAPGLRERQVVLLPSFAGGTESGRDLGSLWQPLAPAEQQKARHRYGIAAAEFAVILIGKDGGEKKRWHEPVKPQTLYGVIDAMPMRQDEMQHSPGRD